MSRHVAIIVSFWLVASAATIAFVLSTPLLPVVASLEGLVSDEAFITLLVLSVPVFFLVQVVLVYSLVRFRTPVAAGDGPAIAGNRVVETIWLGASLVLVLWLAAFGWQGMDRMRAATVHGGHASGAAGEPAELRVKVVGSQFAWRFEYPELGVKSVELRVPKDRPVRFELTSVDVLHSFWVSAFRLKQDVVPGRTITVAVTPTRAGRYEAECTALCGAGHTVMRSPVEVMEAPAFDAWISARRAAVAP